MKEFFKLVFATPEYYALFWNSIKVCFLIIAGQLIFAVPAAWGLARIKSRSGKAIFAVYTVCMILPFQCTMLSQYIVLNKMNLLDSHLSLILPLIFSTFPVFIIYNSFIKIEDEVLEAARIDGAGELRIFFGVGIPMAARGIASSALLGFFEYWNMVEQPILFIKTKTKMVLSEFVPYASENAPQAIAFAVMSVVPALIIAASCMELINVRNED